MPKPVLSDSLFNADDVASAIVSNVDLGVINTDLAVTDINSHFTISAGWECHRGHYLFFNGFVFLSGYYIHSDGTPDSGEIVITIENSTYKPNSDYSFPSISNEGDLTSNIVVDTNGNIRVYSPLNVGSSNYCIVLNGFYNTNF